MDAASVPFAAPYAADDVTIAGHLFATVSAAAAGADAGLARRLLEAMRNQAGRIGGIDEVLHRYSISTKEGAALMVLAEALLRVPEPENADRLIIEKLEQGGFGDDAAASEPLIVAASAWVLGLGARILAPEETPAGIVHGLVRRIGMPAARAAARSAMGLLGDHFVMGQTIEEAVYRSRRGEAAHYRYSFDMLGEGARTRTDAERYCVSYMAAIEAIGAVAGERALPDRPGISVKLSALHPRYEAVNREKVLGALVPAVLELARAAKRHDLNFTVDAEEADRLELSLDVFGRVLADSSLRGWDGFGLAVQAYQKRAQAVIAHVSELAGAHARRLMVRLVKGAYWDTEIKRAQERGLPDYPVFTRKPMTDLNYLACAQDMLAAPRLYPQFATHNALSIATIVAMAGDAPFEFQRLYGMGDALYRALREEKPRIPCRTYAPVGGHRDLLAYLVRRLLENGANSSFVMNAGDHAVPAERLLRSPIGAIGKPAAARHPRVPLPPRLYGAARLNSRGIEFGHLQSLNAVLEAMRAASKPPAMAVPLVDGRAVATTMRPVTSPIDAVTVAGHVGDADETTIAQAFGAATAGFSAWSRTPAAERAAALERAADALEANRGRFLHLLTVEAGKTLDDAVAEVREAVDFCRYYAAEGRRLFAAPVRMVGPTGESNELALRGRGVFVAISPWNFPLAIFTGQIAAALTAGNAVIAKPAKQTPLIAAEAVRLLHASGVPPAALHLLPGDGRVGARLVAHPDVAGVAFTGSTEVARAINRTLAAKDGPIVPFIAETGGINAMIVDSTALPEQVADDVVTSAFRSAGQRCSALRLLCVQDDVAGPIVEMIEGAARELNIGDPRDPATHVGPVIDREAKDKLDAYLAARRASGRILYAGRAPEKGTYVAPHIVRLTSAGDLTEEIFGPILHVVSYAAGALDDVIAAIGRSGYGLTLGVHSRLTSTVTRAMRLLPVGNVYVNRNMIGAVVGVQPFGGFGLSGTGPKAGGPHYLARFATEQTVTVNTAAIGGNTELASLSDEAAPEAGSPK
jgi:RHH-type proline utilization regulon transcriptional repressor/proline dehydrogenase/delta 1-pyrroline-5-carboxylate dehydrogenase